MPKILDDADFENTIKEFSDRELAEFSARQIFAICQTCEIHTRQIAALQKHDTKVFGAVGGIAAFIGTAIGAGILYIYEKISKG